MTEYYTETVISPEAMSNLEQPPVSVLIPIRNGIGFLLKFKENLLSIVSSTDQIVIVNDNSTDATFDFLEEWAFQDSRVLLLQNPKNGLVNALNAGLAVAKYDWVARFDVDDICDVNRLKIQRQQLKSGVAAVFCDYEIIDVSGNNLGVIHSAVLSSPTVLSLISGQRTAHPGAIFNRKMSLEVGGYRSIDFPAEDLSLWIRLAHKGELISVPEVLLKYRLTSNSVTASNRELSKIKKKKLTQNNSIINHALHKSLENFNAILRDYQEIQNGYSRIALFYRDMFLASHTTNLKFKLIKRILNFNNLSILLRTTRHALKMHAQRRIRQKLRNMPNPSV